jgi:hypothetical protein
VVELCLLGVDESTLFSSFEDLFEVQLLADICHIHDSVSLVIVYTVSEGSKISSSVPEASIRLLNHKRWTLLLADEDAHSSLVFNCMTFFGQFCDKTFQEGVVETLALLCEFDVKPVVDDLEFVTRELTKHFPSLDASLVTTLKLDHISLSCLFEGFVFIVSLFGTLVESLQIRNVWHIFKEVRELFVKLLDEHAELSAPVSDVVNSQHVVAQELENTADGVSLNCGSQVTNMHVLGDVWTREVNKHSLCRLCVTLFFFSPLVCIRTCLKMNFLLSHDSVDSLEYKLLFQEDVQEITTFVVRPLANLREFNFLDGVIFWNVLNDCGGHVFARLEAKAALLFKLIKELHRTWTLVVPVSLLFNVDSQSFLKFGHCLLSSPLQDGLEVFWN